VRQSWHRIITFAYAAACCFFFVTGQHTRKDDDDDDDGSGNANGNGNGDGCGDGTRNTKCGMEMMMKASLGDP